MTITRTIIVYSAYNGVYTKEFDLIPITEEMGDIRPFDDWAMDEYSADGLLCMLQNAAAANKSAQSVLEKLVAEYKEWVEEQIDDLLDEDNTYHRNSIEVTLDL